MKYQIMMAHVTFGSESHTAGPPVPAGAVYFTLVCHTL